MLIQIHMLQNYAPSLLNRDDSGAAKSAYFGDSQRGRISSQCLKRSIRWAQPFRDAFEKDGLLATRTKRLPGLVDEALQNLGADETTRTAIVQRVPEIGQESSKKDKEKIVDLENLETRQLIFVNAREVEEIAQKLLAMYQQVGAAKWEKLKIEEITKQLGGSVPRSVDIALFGRMTTTPAFEDVQAACQVAHAISTNALTRVYDYFTAVDDLKKADVEADAGAGMIGDVELNSSTYYKYFNIHWEGLVENLGGDEEIARRAVLAFLEAAALAHPSGKQNSTAAFQLPDFVLVEVSKRNLPVSYANAFLKPVQPDFQNTLLQKSIHALDKYAQTLRKAYPLKNKAAYFNTVECSLGFAKDVESLTELQEWVDAQITEALHG